MKDEKISLKENIEIIFKNIKGVFRSKDKKEITKVVGKMLYTLFVAILIKVPFIFAKTIFLDFLNNNDISYNIQNILSGFIEFIYIIVAILIIYKYLKKYFINK